MKGSEKYYGNAYEVNQDVNRFFSEKMNNGEFEDWSVEIKSKVNASLHRKFFAFANIIGGFAGKTKDEVVCDIKYKMEFYDFVGQADDVKIIAYKSISFEKMDGEKFKEFYFKATHIACELYDLSDDQHIQLNSFY